MFELIYEQAVARGRALLDEVVPDWREYVSAKTLDMQDAGACVVAQLGYAGRLDRGEPGEPVGYLTALLYLVSQSTNYAEVQRWDFGRVARHFGFEVPVGFELAHSSVCLAAYEELTRAWMMELAAVPA